ncbi:hypothetical protein VFMJ11_A0682 [Aliivibrio fischeri MJ11]|uniref:Uncharacterized protein n=1 Tax=Aliivibrio fischeri (strain MJ11) TaxID=388396 RepID=B5EU63_ALIFM|nr:hypothetical protein VFMJ11_A0682 [Aliivibrio fischeri MJ11]
MRTTELQNQLHSKPQTPSVISIVLIALLHDLCQRFTLIGKELIYQ